MRITIRVWGDFDRSSRTPLLHQDECYAVNYGSARIIGEAKRREFGGKTAHVDCQGPNQNMNSIWVGQ